MSIEWVPIGQSDREREYHEIVSGLAALDFLIGLAPTVEETGYAPLSPFRPPMYVRMSQPQKLLGCVKIAGLLPPGPEYGRSSMEQAFGLLHELGWREFWRRMWA